MAATTRAVPGSRPAARRAADKSRPRSLGRLLRVLVVGLGLGASCVAAAQGTAAPAASAAESQARKLVAEAEGALASHDLPRARQLVERAYRLAPLPELLLPLGRLAQAEGRSIPAADLFRRYLDSVGEQADAATRSMIARHQATLPAPISEVQVTAPEGSLFLVDGRPVGQTPLPGPLLIAPGPRRFAIEIAGKNYESDPLSVPAGRPAHVNLTPGARSVAIAVLSLTPATLLGLTLPPLTTDKDKAWAEAVRRAIAAAVEKEQTVIVSQERLATLLGDKPADCLTQPQCQEQLADQVAARSVLRVAVRAAPQSAAAVQHFSVSVHDVATGQTAASTQVHCDACSQSAALGQLGDAVRRMITEANNRPRGQVAVTSLPSGADVLLDGRPLGKTPLERMSFSGPHAVTVTQSGYVPQQTQVDVVIGQLASVATKLVRLPAGSERSTGKRPLWRLVVGGVALGGGLLAAGFGISGVTYDGTCGDSTQPDNGLPCQTIYLTRVIGGSLLGGGLALSVAGAILLAIPPARATPPLAVGVGENSGPTLALDF